MVVLARAVLPTPRPVVPSALHVIPDAPAVRAEDLPNPDVPVRSVAFVRASSADASTRASAGGAETLPSASPDASGVETAWRRVEALRARLDALEGDGGATGRVAAGALRMIEVPQILEEAGVSDEPFAARLAAYRDAVADGGRPDALRASVFAAEDLDRLRLLDALHAL